MPRKRKVSTDFDAETDHNRIVPGPWVEKIRADWPHATDFEVEFRRGARGAWRPVPAGTAPKVEVLDADEKDPVVGVEQARDYAQRLFDACWEHRDGQDGRCDYRLRSWGPDKTGEGRVEVGGPEGKGGRLEQGRSEDVPNVENESDGDAQHGLAAGILSEVRAERREWVGLLLKLGGQFTDLLDRVGTHLNEAHKMRADVASQARQMRLDELDAQVSGHRTEAAKEMADRFMTEYQDVFRLWASAKYQESLGKRKRAPTGNALLDALGAVADSMDIVTMGRVREVVGAEVSQRIADLILSIESATPGDVAKTWAELREPLTPHWRRLMDVLPMNTRAAVIELANAVEAHEKSGAA